MPRPRKPARLWLRPADGGRPAEWVILDAGRQIRTGCPASGLAGAEARLAAHVAGKAPERPPEAPAAVADALAYYTTVVTARSLSKDQRRDFLKRIGHLNDALGDKPIARLTGADCRDYATKRARTTARRELEDLRAALKLYEREKAGPTPCAIPLPEKSPPRPDWLTREQLARLVWAAWRGEGKHVARFTLAAYYTCSRPGAILGATLSQIEGDLFHRAPPGARVTKKRQPPVRLPDGLASHIRRWMRHKIARRYLIEHEGRPVGDIHKAWATACTRAKVRATPHTLRHTGITHMLQRGVSVWDVAGFAGATAETIDRVYGHHCANHQDAARASYRKRLPIVAGNVTVQRYGKTEKTSKVVASRGQGPRGGVGHFGSGEADLHGDVGSGEG